MFIKEFFSTGFTRTPEGYLSWQHLLWSFLCMAVAVTVALLCARKAKKDLTPLKIAAVFMVACEVLKVIVFYLRSGWSEILGYNLPLFLCSVSLYILPLAAFCKGGIKRSSLDFLFVFGVLGMLLGTLAAGNVYSRFPVLHFNPVISTCTHCISGFAAIYIGARKLYTMRLTTVLGCAGLLCVIMAIAYVANITVPGGANYMFFRQSDGTPFFIVENICGGPGPVYTVAVALLQIAYIFAFFGAFKLVKRLFKRKKLGTN